MTHEEACQAFLLCPCEYCQDFKRIMLVLIRKRQREYEDLE